MTQGADRLLIRYKDNREPQEDEENEGEGEGKRWGRAKRSKFAVAWRPGLGQASARLGRA